MKKLPLVLLMSVSMAQANLLNSVLNCLCCTCLRHKVKTKAVVAVKPAPVEKGFEGKLDAFIERAIINEVKLEAKQELESVKQTAENFITKVEEKIGLKK